MTECNQSCVDVCVVPDCYNLSIVRGTYNRFQIILTDGDNKAIAINNDTVEFIIKDDPGGSVIVSKSNGPGDHSDPANGTTIFEIENADSLAANETTSTYWSYEVRRTNPLGDVFVHITGQFTVRPTI